MGDLESRWLGQSVEQIKKLFRDARAQGPLVLFVDEAETAMGTRIDDGSSHAASINTKVTTFLAEIIACMNFSESGIIFCAATNFVDRIDPAISREGRFDFKREINLPDAAARLGLMMARTPSDCVYADSSSTGAANAAERAANRWEGFDIPRVQNVVDEAVKLARAEPKVNGRSVISFEMLMAALRVLQGGMGDVAQERAKSLDELGFDADIGDRLKRLAKRMTEIERIESRGGSVPKAVLFTGPPGTGKTVAARALAKSANWAYLGTTGTELLNDRTDKMLDKLLDKASTLRPCIVFIDEANDIISDRAYSNNGAATNKLLEAIDGKRPLQDVMFIAATNFAAGIDDAATRGGRFSEKFAFAPPSENTLAGILRDFMALKKTAPWHTEFTPEAAARLLAGFAPSDAIDNLQKTINQVVTDGDEQIRLADLQAILNCSNTP